MLRLLKIFCLTGSIPVTLCVGFNVCLVKLADWQLANSISRSQADIKLIENLLPQNVPDDENAATRLQEITSPLNSVAKLLPFDIRTTGVLRPMTASETAKLKLVFELHRPTLLAVQKAAACEHYVPAILKREPSLDTREFDWTALAERLRRLRAAQSLLATHVRLADLNKATDEAAHSCLAMFRLARHADHEPMRTGFAAAMELRRMAIHTTNLVVQSNRLSRSRRDELEAELAKHELSHGYAQAVDWERAYFVTNYLSEECSPEIGNWLVAGVTRQVLASRLNQWQREMSVAAMNYTQMLQHFGKPIPRSASDDSQSKNTANPVDDALQKLNRDLFLEQCVVTAELRCLRVINALRLRGVDQLPAATPLAELGLPAEMIVDPFNGETLRVGKAPLGMVIYSVGANLSDEAGRNIAKREDVGLGPAFIIQKISVRNHPAETALAENTFSP